jgi:1-acyl-sn-glycerol-3-phosphate acyltransferase
LIFPEGKETQTGEVAAFRTGIGVLAQRLNIPVIPMRIDGLFAVKQAHRIVARPGQVKVKIGSPVSFSSDGDPAEIAKELERRVSEL